MLSNDIALNVAIKIAAQEHMEQKDKVGRPYIFHPLRVMMSLPTVEQQICGVLHDVIEDGNITLDDLKFEGFSEDIISALDCLTRRNGETYNDFIERILQNTLACYVKLADIEDNNNPDRLALLDYETAERLSKKYMDAYNKITEHLMFSN